MPFQVEFLSFVSRFQNNNNSKKYLMSSGIFLMQNHRNCIFGSKLTHIIKMTEVHFPKVFQKSCINFNSHLQYMTMSLTLDFEKVFSSVIGGKCYLSLIFISNLEGDQKWNVMQRELESGTESVVEEKNQRDLSYKKPVIYCCIIALRS